MKTTSLYDFTLTANGTFVILADANFYKVLTSTGDIQVTRDGGATIKPLRAGRGERNVPFQRLIIKDISGAPNSGTILVGDSDFIDDTIVISSAINVRPEAASGSYKNNVLIVANTPETVFAPGANTAGAIIQAAGFNLYGGGFAVLAAFVAKNAAPANPMDGEPVLFGGFNYSNAGGSNVTAQHMPQPIFVPAGLGLYFIADTATGATGGASARFCRYKLL